MSGCMVFQDFIAVINTSSVTTIDYVVSYIVTYLYMMWYTIKIFCVNNLLIQYLIWLYNISVLYTNCSVLYSFKCHIIIILLNMVSYCNN